MPMSWMFYTGESGTLEGCYGEVIEAISKQAFYSTMRFVWSPAKEVAFRVISDNLFVVQANCLGNWKKMTEGGPWNFRGLGILMDKYDGVSPPEEIVLDSLEVWIQIHRIPGIYRKVELVDKRAG